MSAASAPPPSGSGSKARQPPKFVYRGDTREPSVMFKEGFKPRGGGDGSDDLLAHVKGGENLLKTGLISTSQSRRTPAAFIREARKPDGSEDAIVDNHNPEIKYKRRIGWIYTISTSGLNMIYVPDQLNDKDLTKYGYQQEWAIKGPIPGKNIKEAQNVDGYIYRYSDPVNMKQGVDPLYPPGKSPYKEVTNNKGYGL